MYPNPASNFVSISLDDFSGAISVVIFDQLGRRVLEKDIENVSNELQIPLNKMNKGIYYVQVISKTTKSIKKLIIK